MSNEPAGPTTPSDGHTHPSLNRRDAAGAWFTKAGKVTVVTILVAAVVVALFLIASAFLPRQWALVIGRQVDGNIGQGTLWGLFYGFLFTLLPVLVIGQARRAMFSTLATQGDRGSRRAAAGNAELAHPVDRAREHGCCPRGGAHP